MGLKTTIRGGETLGSLEEEEGLQARAQNKRRCSGRRRKQQENREGRQGLGRSE